MKRKWKIVIILIILAAIITLFYVVTKKKAPNDELTLFGNIEIRQVDLSFQVPGQILKMLKEEGDSVAKGELIAVLDDRDYADNLSKAKADVQRTKAVSENALAVYNRKAPLCGDNTISKQECDNLLYNKNETKAAYEAAVANMNFTDNQLKYTKAYAPDEGIVTVRVQEPGATVAKGQIIYTVVKNKPIWVRAYVPETHLGNIKYGIKAVVCTDSKDPETGEKRQYEGRIGYISPIAEFTPKTVQTEDLRTDLVYRIRVYIDDTDAFLRQGMPVTVKIKLLNQG
ncbi:MAG: efflux RND transporter periplasmic adaptor subunit [Candidatus Gastranaerophilales bacterium]|nr:efflux RND transporter periplasmic adaptor subunit [Candidatus Gastranaerophilales bacterium]